MRLTADHSPGAPRSTGPDFSAFAYHESDEDGRMPDKEFMGPMKRLPALSSGNAKRRIVVSDDEDEDEDDDDGWMDSRDVKRISEKERERNVKAAMAQRKATRAPAVSQPIKKAPKRKFESDEDDEESEIDDTPKRVNMKKVLHRSNLIANSLLNNFNDDDSENELDPVEQVRRFKRQEKKNNRAARAANRGAKHAHTKGTIDLCDDDESEASADSSETEESSSSGEEMKWRDDVGAGELREKANQVMRNCDKVSSNLRRSLKEWQSGGGGGEDKDCVDLITIEEKPSSSLLLHDSDVAVLCPQLRLKAYQLVGVNWMRLLHENDVNGVLADDMGLGKTVQTIAFLAWLKSSGSSSSDGGGGGGRKTRPHLIVVPASTLANWQNELARFCPALRVVTYHGSQNERANLRQELRSDISAGAVDVILSTYTIFERESGKSDRSFLYNQSFDYMILDEAHCIKNQDSSRYVSLNQMKTRHRLLLSGTPVQNDLGELLAMLSFLMPSVFGRDNCDLLMEAFGWTKGASAAAHKGNISLLQLRGMLVPFVLRRLKRDVLDQLTEKTNRLEMLGMTDFQRKVYDSVLLGHTLRRDRRKAAFDESERQLSVIDVKPTKKSAVVAVASKAAPVVAAAPSGRGKRLTKLEKELIDLTSPSPPVKKSESMSVMSAAETALSLPVEEEATSTVDLTLLDDEGSNELQSARLTQDSAADVVNELSASEANHLFTALRKAANHPLLLRVRYKDEAVMERIAMVAYHQEHFGSQCDYARVRAELDKYSDFDLHLICLEYPDSLGGYELDASVLYDSPKMKQLRGMLPSLQAEGHRMLIFSQWTRLLDLLGVLLADMGMPCLRLDGSTPVRERQELIDIFTHDTSIPVFLLSTKAGGLGINLTSADTVILHDLDFNPENDRQAEDRCHRIGQTKPVTVYKLVTKDTVDELIYEMGERKRQLSQAVLSDERAKGSAVGKSPLGRAAPEGEEDANAISKMLQRALAQRSALTAGAPTAVAVPKMKGVPTVSPEDDEWI